MSHIPQDAARRLVDKLGAAAPHPPIAQPQAALTCGQLESLLSAHFGAHELSDDEADSARALARAVERAHGIGSTGAQPQAAGWREVFSEVDRAIAKFPTWPTDPLHALAVLGEEFGELTKDMLQLTYEPHKTTREKVRTEAIQTAAMALRLAASLDRYVYRPCEQHSQSAPLPEPPKEGA